MAASKIMIIRHAEKPNGTVQGVDADGTSDPESLIVQGWQRAGALATFLTSADASLSSLGLAVPDIIIASDDHKHPSDEDPATTSSAEMKGSDEGSRSKRPTETVTPLAAKLHQSINVDYWLGDEKALYKDLIAPGGQITGVVLVCWQHERISKITNRLVRRRPRFLRLGRYPNAGQGTGSTSYGSSIRPLPGNPRGRSAKRCNCS